MKTKAKTKTNDIAQLVVKHGDNWRLEASGQTRRSADANSTTEWWDMQWAITRFDQLSTEKGFWDESARHFRRERRHYCCSLHGEHRLCPCLN